MKQKTHKKCAYCRDEFKFAFSSLQKYCSPKCQLDDKKSKPIKRKAIAPVSQKRLGELVEYRKLKKEFMALPENKICPVTGLPATEIHHMNGRENDRLNNTEFFLAVSRAGHKWIHANPNSARAKGWLI